ncbi:hypothetical protein HK097_002578, partial [Rhizophlyctis rosea]
MSKAAAAAERAKLKPTNPTTATALSSKGTAINSTSLTKAPPLSNVCKACKAPYPAPLPPSKLPHPSGPPCKTCAKLATIHWPTELLEEIFSHLPSRTQRFHLGVTFRLLKLRDSAIPLLSSSTISDAARRGQTDLLQWWFDHSKHTLNIFTRCVNVATTNGHVHVLQWLKDMGLSMNAINTSAITTASEKGYIEVLEWWLTSGVKCEFEFTRLQNVDGVKVLEWWKGSGVDLSVGYGSKDAMDHASARGSVHVLQWYKENELMFYTFRAMDWASMYGRVDVLQ